MFIYVIGTFDKQKIGFSSNVQRRLKTLQTGNHETLYIHHTIEVPDEQARFIEKTIHREYSYLRIKGEWFKMSISMAISCLDHALIRWVDNETHK